MRCFVALWPDEPARDRLEALARTWQQRYPCARRMQRANLHLTLAFIGELDEDSARRAAESLTQQAWQAGTWRLDRIGAFAHARVLWAGSGDDPPLAAIAAQVRARLDQLKVRYDRKPFAPHVTLLRNLPRAASGVAQMIEAPIEWPLQRPLLLRSAHDAGATRYVAFAPAA